MTQPLVDVVIPLHRGDRPIDVALASCRSDVQGVETRAIVVLHGLQLEPAAAAELDAKATVLRCDDDLRSPSGPRNVGISSATAPFLFFLDSDDRLAPGCLRQLLDAANETGADVVLPSVSTDTGYVGVPFVWSRSPRLLDPARDGLFLRGRSFALVRRAALERTGIRFPEGIRTGEDFVFMSRLSSELDVAMAFGAVYLLGAHEGERITTDTMTVDERLAPARHVLTSGWFRALPPALGTALAERILSVNLANEWRHRQRIAPGPLREGFTDLRDLAVELAPSAIRMLSVRDRQTLRYEDRPARWRRLLLAKPFGLVPSSPRAALHPRGPLRAEVRRRIAASRRGRPVPG
jgi:glycosyltransferase involved in cell wall biosynthesis